VGTFELVRAVAAPPAATFEVVGDLTAYGAYLPLTRIRADPGPIGPGWRFTARTGPGPLSVVDRMQVTRWDPPHGFAVTKLGPVLDGWAEVSLSADGAGTRLRWREEITVRSVSLGRRLSVISDPVNRWLFGRAVDRMIVRVRQG
jgi:carbon monoxide dehydrogenase subunit G